MQGPGAAGSSLAPGAPVAAVALRKPGCGLPVGKIPGFQINAAPLLSPDLATSREDALRFHTLKRLVFGTPLLGFMVCLVLQNGKPTFPLEKHA